MKIKKEIKIKDIKKLPKDFKVLVIDGIMLYKGVDGYFYKSWLMAAVSFLGEYSNISGKYSNITDIFEYLADIFNKEGIKINSLIIKNLLYKKFEGELKSKDLDELALKTIKEIYLNNLTIEFDFLEGNFYPTDKEVY